MRLSGDQRIIGEAFAKEISAYTLDINRINIPKYANLVVITLSDIFALIYQFGFY